MIKSRMPILCFSAIHIILLTFFYFNNTEASDRNTTCYHLYPESKKTVASSSEQEKSRAIAEQSLEPARLCVTSRNLNKFPRSVVTVSFWSFARKNQPKIQPIKRHYSMLAPHTLGRWSRPNKPMVVFNENRHKVFIGFINSPSGQTFSFRKDLSPPIRILEKQ